MKNLKELYTRIKNVKSIQKITKIMQTISATKLSQNQKKLATIRIYLSKLHNIISLVPKKEKLHTTDDSPYLLFIISSDRGLCGSFNSSIVKFSQKYIEDFIMCDKKIDIIFLGKKAFDLGKYKLNSYVNILKVEESKNVTLEYLNMLVTSIYLDKYSKVKIFYNKFYNTFSYKSTLETIKPWDSQSTLVNAPTSNKVNITYEYEPDNSEFILEYLRQDYTAAALYCTLLESATSENSSRMIAMESAHSNAKEMIHNLSLSYNRSRQAAITTDLIEIISGAEFS